MPRKEPRYTAIAQWLHWLIAALIICQYVLAELAEVAAERSQLSQQLLLLANHKSVGMTVLMLALVRIFWRLWHPPPAPPASMPRWQRRVAVTVHWLIYGLILAIPLSGWLLSSATSYSVSWFGLFQWPDLIAANADRKEQLLNVHHWLGEGLLILVIGHALAALKHRLLDGDHVLPSMLGRAPLTASLAVLAGGIWWLGVSVMSVAPAAQAQAASDRVAEPAAMAEASTAPVESVRTDESEPPPLWQVDADQSHIVFIAEQAGARFEGRWQRWRAEIRFDPAQLSRSSAVVTIEAQSAETQDSDRDDTLATDDWFAARQHPVIRFTASEFESLTPTPNAPAPFRARAQLQVKDRAVPVLFDFVVVADGKRRTLTGTATLNRLELGLGTGEWSDPDSVGHTVKVQVTVVATVP